VFFTPASAEREIRAWLGPGKIYAAQAGADLGERMLAAFRAVFDDGIDRAVLVGTDCPALSATHLERALRMLRRKDIVLGPSVDGGYYLVGASRVHPALFKDVPWSTDAVFQQTMTIIRRQGLRCALLPVLRDVDKEEDLEHYRARGCVLEEETAGETFSSSSPG
jgi:rSAM/selenodomain-associated transferase 1